MFRIFFVFVISFFFIGCSIKNVKDTEKKESENTFKRIPITVLSANGFEKRGELIKISEDICIVRTEEVSGLKRFNENLSLPIIKTEETMIYCDKIIDKDFFEKMHDYYKNKEK